MYLVNDVQDPLQVRVIPCLSGEESYCVSVCMSIFSLTSSVSVPRVSGFMLLSLGFLVS